MKPQVVKEEPYTTVILDEVQERHQNLLIRPNESAAKNDSKCRSRQREPFLDGSRI